MKKANTQRRQGALDRFWIAPFVKGNDQALYDAYAKRKAVELASLKKSLGL